MSHRRKIDARVCNNTKYLRIKNWNTFQHYKDRNPPWIKLHTDIFQNYEFSCLQDASKLLAICSYALAARTTNGEIPADLDYIKRQCNISDLIQQAHLDELINKGFLIEIMAASDTLASCEQVAIPETEAETEAEIKTEILITTEQYSARKEKIISEKIDDKKIFELPAKLSNNFETAFVIYESTLAQYQKNYPCVDVMQKLIDLKNWMIKNNCRKNICDMSRWLNEKLSEEQSKGAEIKKLGAINGAGSANRKKQSGYKRAMSTDVQLVSERYQ